MALLRPPILVQIVLGRKLRKGSRDFVMKNNGCVIQTWDSGGLSQAFPLRAGGNAIGTQFHRLLPLLAWQISAA